MGKSSCTMAGIAIVVSASERRNEETLMTGKFSCILLTLICCTLLILAGCRKPSLDKAIRDSGYTPLALASTSYQPGKLTCTVQPDPYEGNTVCEYGSYIGTPSASKDKAASTKANEKLTGTFSMGADFLQTIKADASFNHVTDITVSLSNVFVEEISDNKFIRGVPRQEPDCTQAIRMHSNRPCLGFIQNALRADGVYQVKFDQKANLTVETQQELLKNFASKIGLSYEPKTDSQIEGTSLYWGIKPPRPDLVLTPDDLLQIGNLHLLNEKLLELREDPPYLKDLQQRNSVSIRYRNPNDLMIAFIFTVNGHTIRTKKTINIHASASIRDAADRELYKEPFVTFTNVNSWQESPNAQKIGIDKIARYLNISLNDQPKPIVCIALFRKFEQDQIPNGPGKIVIIAEDKDSGAIAKQEIPIQTVRE